MFARVCCFFLIALAGGYGSVWAEGSAWQASGPAGPGASVRAPSHPAEDGLYSRLKKMPYLYDNKDAEFLTQFKLLLTGQYQGAQVSPSGANRFRKGSHGRENEWRRLQIGFEAVFFKNRLTLHSLTNMGELDGMYKVEDGRWRRTKTDWSIFELYLKYKVNPSFFARVGKITSKMTAEFRETASELKTLERSDLVNQLGTISSWGVVLENPRQDVPVGWEASVFLNDTSDSLAHEIRFNTADNAFAKASVHLDARGFLPGEKSRVWAWRPGCGGGGLGHVPGEIFHGDGTHVRLPRGGDLSGRECLRPGGIAFLQVFPASGRRVPLPALPWAGRRENVRPLCSRGDHLSQMGQHDELLLLRPELLFFPGRPGHAEIDGRGGIYDDQRSAGRRQVLQRMDLVCRRQVPLLNGEGQIPFLPGDWPFCGQSCGSRLQQIVCPGLCLVVGREGDGKTRLFPSLPNPP